MRRIAFALAILSALVMPGPVSMDAASGVKVPVVLVNPAPGDCYVGPGCLDGLFGLSGKATLDVEGRPQYAYAMAAQPLDGKILVAGASMYHAGPNAWDWVVARFSPGGAIDMGFGSNGVIKLHFYGSPGATPTYNSNEQARAIAVQPDGHILVAGWGVAAPASGGAYGYTAVLRFDENGSPDTTFGSGGTVRFDNSTGGVVLTGMKIQPDGKIVLVSGSASMGSTVVRLNSSGSVDTTFGVRGFRSVGTASSAGTDFSATALALQSNGSIIVGGVNVARSDFVVCRLTSKGAVDTKFGSSGKTTLDFFGQYDYLASVAVAADNSIVAVGRAYSTAASESSNMAFARLTANGALSTAFGTSGRVVLDIHGGFDNVNDVAFQADGKIVFAGSGRQSALSYAGAIVGRLMPNGALDTTFGSVGVTETSFGVSDAFFGLVIGPDGITAAGYTYTSMPTDPNTWILARYYQ